ncbi:MAG: metallophosphoesterase [Phycisphaeraceae bacterium]
MPAVCFIADTHRKHRELEIPPCDVLIHCGDVCSFRQDDRETIQDIDEWFAQQSAGKVLCVAGNHDFELEKKGFRFEHAELLTDRLIEVAGLKIYGSPWCPDLEGFAFFQPVLGLKKNGNRFLQTSIFSSRIHRHTAFSTCLHLSQGIWVARICWRSFPELGRRFMHSVTSTRALAKWNAMAPDT